MMNHLTLNSTAWILSMCLSAGAAAQTLVWSQKANPLNLAVNSVAFRNDGQKVLSGTNCHPASIRMYDLSTSNLEWDYNVGMSMMCIMGVTFSSNSQYIAAIEEFGNILLFDNTGPSPTILDTISTGTSFGFATAISPNNTQVAVACSNGKLKVYNLANSQLVHDINAHISWVTTVAYSPNGNTLVTGGNDDRVKVWSNSGTLLHTLMGHTGDITQVKVTPDNSHIVSASKDNSIKIWNLATGALERTLTIHTTDVLSMDPSPDGSKWVSSAADGNCILWEWSSGNALATFGVPDSGAVNSVAWSPTGSHIAAGNASSDVMLWGVSSIVGIENPVNNPNEQVLVYPNPTQNQLWLTLPANQVTERIALTDLQGRVVVEVFGDQTSIDIHALPTGTYLLSVFVHQQPAHTQIVIKQ